MNKFNINALISKLKHKALTLFNKNKRNKTYYEFFD